MERSMMQNIAHSVDTAIWIALSLGIWLYLIEDNGCYNSIHFRERFNDQRVKVDLQPFVDGWKYEKSSAGDMWYNPNPHKHGLSCTYKNQVFDHDLLVLERDAWAYREGDSVHFYFHHDYFFHRIKFHHLLPDSTNHQFQMGNLHECSNDFLRRHGQSIKDSIAFNKTILFLRKRADSLQSK